ncbi:MAG: hypothetical protein IPN26_17370 [Bacteroidetes bacterium]|nr:hypothetical protein [Bacteroidota bacterium]
MPDGWQLLPNIAVFQERIERGHINEELLSVTIGRGVIKQTDVDIKKDSSNEDKSKYKLIKVGDIAYNKMRMWQGALGYSDYRRPIEFALYRLQKNVQHCTPNRSSKQNCSLLRQKELRNRQVYSE